MENVKFVGTKINIDNQVFVMPTLSIGQHKRHNVMKQIKEVQKVFSSLNDEGKEEIDFNGALDKVVNLVHLALTRNYPDISKEFIEDNLDFEDIMTLLALLNTQDKGNLLVKNEGN